MDVGDERNARGRQHPFGSPDAGGVRVFIVRVDDRFDAALDDGLGAFVAGDQRDVQFAALQAAPPVI